MRNDRLMATAWCGAALLTFCVISSKAIAEDSARVITYHTEGQTFYAMSLLPEVELERNDASSIVVLFDTSASQQGAYRAAAMAALETMLADLRPKDRVELLAVDLGVQPMTEGRVTPGSTELKEAVDRLQQQVPLGSTDLAGALQAAAERVAGSGVQHRCVVYIGDGISASNLLDTETLAQVVGELRDARVSVTSFAIGPKIDAQLLAVLANHTGGNLYVQHPMVWQDEAAGISNERAESENLRNAQVAGKQLAGWTTAAVLWPNRVDFPMELGQTYPSVMPPLRSDRDTIVVGTTTDTLPKTMKLNLQAKGPAGPVALNWTARPEPSQEDHAFLVEIIGVAQADEGVSLPTLGSAGLAEAARLVGARMDQLTQLAKRAVAVGNHQAAAHIAQAVLRSDPGNAQARTVQHVVAQADRSDESATPTEGKDAVVLQGDARADSSGDLLGEAARDGLFLDQVEQERRVFAEMLGKEIQNTVLDARKNMTTNPQEVIQDLKIALESVQRASDLDAPKRAELVDKLRTALKEARFQASLKDELDRQREEELAASQARKLLNERLTRRIEREKQLMARLGALI
ncbi:MAG: VWA domain-containing protein, partial [Pirellulales bacterium]|nr:VWA domain-containing protein [Pirellulales bacterium]